MVHPSSMTGHPRRQQAHVNSLILKIVNSGKNQTNHMDSGFYECRAQVGTHVQSAYFLLSIVAGNVTTLSSSAGSDTMKACEKHEATCANGKCIDRSRLCDGNCDCTDASDEINGQGTTIVIL